MISGTIYNAGKLLKMTQKWEQKKLSGNILKKENPKDLTPQEQQLQMYKEQLEKSGEGNEYSAIYAKIQSGQELSPAEEDILRAKDPRTYMSYKADKMEQEAYEKKLKNCKTKEEAERLHVNRMNAKLTELKNIVNNPNISKSEKLKEAQRILGDTMKISKIFHDFTKSQEFQELPTEEELMEANRAEAEMQEEQMLEASDTDIEKVPKDLEKKEGTSKVPEETVKEPVKSENKIKDIPYQNSSSEEEKRILNEMFEIEEKYFGEKTKAVRIDVSL